MGLEPRRVSAPLSAGKVRRARLPEMANRTSALHDATRQAAWTLDELGRELRIARVAAGLTQSRVAKGIGTYAVTGEPDRARTHLGCWSGDARTARGRGR